MSDHSLLPLASYNVALKPFNPSPAIEDEYPVTIRLTLAAIDPESVDGKDTPSTLRILKRKNQFIDDEDDEDFVDDEAEEQSEEEEEEEEEEEKPKSKNGKKNTKKASKKEESEDEESEEDDDEEDDDEVEEFVVCTLAPSIQYQQSLDLTINPEEEVYFVVTGSYPIHLTGNYVEHPYDNDDSEDEDEDYDEDSEDEYDLTPDEDEIIEGAEYDLEDLEDASDVENKIEELIDDDKTKKSNKKRAAEEEEKKESKKESKKQKKEKKEKKSVEFSEELEQGPTGSTLVGKAEKSEKKAEKKSDKKEDKKYATKTLTGGVVIEDRKVGSGATAKSGNKVGIRYIGKLKNGKSFDKNTSGKPFVFQLGKGEVIKGFDVGIATMAVGGERRIVIPSKMAYGSKALPGIPANSELTFDVKLVSLK